MNCKLIPVFSKGAKPSQRKCGRRRYPKLLFDFYSTIPTKDVYKGKISSFDYLNYFSADRSNAEVTLEELILLFIANFNPANKQLLELFDEKYLTEKILYNKIISELDSFSKRRKIWTKQDIFTLFKTPILNNPDNIEAQLDFILEKFAILLDEKFKRRILSVRFDQRRLYFRTWRTGGVRQPCATIQRRS